jgi:hypothetical protein
MCVRACVRNQVMMKYHPPLHQTVTRAVAFNGAVSTLTLHGVNGDGWIFVGEESEANRVVP